MLEIKIPAHAAPLLPGQVTTELVGEYEVNIQRSETADPTFRVWLSQAGRFVETKEFTTPHESLALFAFGRATAWAVTNSDADLLVTS